MRLCFITDSRTKITSYEFQSSWIHYRHIRDEIRYALEGISPAFVTLLSASFDLDEDEMSVRLIKDRCHSKSDFYEAQSVIVFQSDQFLPATFFSKFTSEFIVSSINFYSSIALSMRPFVSNLGLSVDLNSIMPIAFASEISLQIEKKCKVPPQLLPSPSSSRSPRECNLVTVCQYELLVYYDSHDRDAYEGFSNVTRDIYHELFYDAFPTASSFWHVTYSDFSFERIVQNCQRKTTFRSPTVIILATDIVIPPRILNRYRSDYIIAIVNFNSEHVDVVKQNIFDPSLSVDWRTVSHDKFASRVSNAVNKFCSSPPGPVPTPTPGIESRRACGSISVCFYYTEPVNNATFSPNENRFKQLNDEIDYALRSELPIYRVSTLAYTFANSPTYLIDRCNIDSTDVVFNPTIIIFESDKQLTTSFFAPYFNEGFIIGAINTERENAERIAPLLSDTSLSVDIGSVSPTSFASSLNSEILSSCRLNQKLASPSPSFSPKECTLLTICSYTLITEPDYHTDNNETSRLPSFYDFSLQTWFWLFNRHPDASFVYTYQYNTTTFQEIVNFCQAKRTFDKPIVIILETDYTFPESEVSQYKSDVIIAAIGLYPETANGLKKSVTHPSLSIDFWNEEAESFGLKINNAIEDFCSTDQVNIGQISPSPTPVFGLPAIREANDLADFNRERSFEENAKISKESAELFIFNELQSFGQNTTNITIDTGGVSSTLSIGVANITDSETTERNGVDVKSAERVQYRNAQRHCNVYRCAVTVTVTSNRPLRRQMIENSLHIYTDSGIDKVSEMFSTEVELSTMYMDDIGGSWRFRFGKTTLLRMKIRGSCV